MTVRFIPASIWNSKAQVLTNPVNTVGVMGAGLALDFKQRYPAMFRHYVICCRNRDLRVGQPILYQDSEVQVLYFPTKEHWRNPSKVEWIEQGFYWLLANHQQLGIRSIAMPKLGCGHGGLDFRHDVQPLMERYFRHADLEVSVFTQ